MKITLDLKSTGIKIYIDELLHLCIKNSEEFIGFQSWKQGTDHYCIEYYTKYQNILTVYNDFNKWKKIIDLLDKI